MENRVILLCELSMQEKQQCNGGEGLSPVTQKFWEFLGELFMHPYVVYRNVGPYAGPVLDK